MNTRLRRVRPWVTPAVVATEITLVWSGLLDWRLAAHVIIEANLWLTVATRASVRYRRSRGIGEDRWRAAKDGLAALAPRRLVHFVLLEPRLWMCLFRWLLGHDDRTVIPAMHATSPTE